MSAPSSSTAAIAIEVDRLVIGVHRAVMASNRSQLGLLVETIGVERAGHLYDLAEFIASGAGTVETARRRFRYEASDGAGQLIGHLRRRRLVDARLRPFPALAEVIDSILLWRAEAAASTWPGNLATIERGAAEALSMARGPLVEVFRSLPEPVPPPHRLHHLLTGLRYARFDAHIAAWEAAGLTEADIVALGAEGGSAPGPKAPAGMVARGWIAVDGAVTAEGATARSTIEAETDARCDVLFDRMPGREAWLEELRSLPTGGD